MFGSAHNDKNQRHSSTGQPHHGHALHQEELLFLQQQQQQQQQQPLLMATGPRSGTMSSPDSEHSHYQFSEEHTPQERGRSPAQQELRREQELHRPVNGNVPLQQQQDQLQHLLQQDLQHLLIHAGILPPDTTTLAQARARLQRDPEQTLDQFKPGHGVRFFCDKVLSRELQSWQLPAIHRLLDKCAGDRLREERKKSSTARSERKKRAERDAEVAALKAQVAQLRTQLQQKDSELATLKTEEIMLQVKPQLSALFNTDVGCQQPERGPHHDGHQFHFQDQPRDQDHPRRDDNYNDGRHYDGQWSS
ncbi:hypothetical protein PTSG_06652 [Salpingoeca rosetta]|uniref:BZIP domain-containing protein n=1 Tax=Salpingoeca rosetta (strain ATCC 50818 / BSB-021) TaxID=946362 RepID=F2UFL5_SALR5|nr:uncharacterized protein PTSG_06652 [Salpingoeca rosetta]EGD75583.1 hypothetical protein PTSG_06652 [Salpingoeca rosetta]|eukprot:XP_004992040.1 hypothetical protein PTSG_06652 [Salpingoeca rosetta]